MVFDLFLNFRKAARQQGAALMRTHMRRARVSAASLRSLHSDNQRQPGLAEKPLKNNRKTLGTIEKETSTPEASKHSCALTTSQAAVSFEMERACASLTARPCILITSGFAFACRFQRA